MSEGSNDEENNYTIDGSDAELDDLEDFDDPLRELDGAVDVWPTSIPSESSLTRSKTMAVSSAVPKHSSHARAKRARRDVGDSPLQKRNDWLQSGIITLLALTLREKSAQALALTWSEHRTMEREMEILGHSSMAIVFKAEIGVHLKGRALSAFLKAHPGLTYFSQQCWPELMQRFLCNIYQELQNLDEPYKVRQDLSGFIRPFRHAIRRQNKVEWIVHRLGLTVSFQQPRLTDTDKIIYDYFWTQDQRIEQLGFAAFLPYPLPHVLRVDPIVTKPFLQHSFTPSEFIRRNEKKWTLNVTSVEMWNEERGLLLSDATVQHRQKSYGDKCVWHRLDEKPLSFRHFLMLNSMAQHLINRAYPAVVVTALLALTHPFYSSDRSSLDEPARAPLLRSCRIDIYWHLSQALSWLYAKIDLPLACLEMARRNVASQQLPCLSERARLALMNQNILARYGFYQLARDQFEAWFCRLPMCSWLHQELVLTHCASVFYNIQDILLAAYITNQIHDGCASYNEKLPCWETYVAPLYKAVQTRLILLKSVLYRCLADLTIREEFRDNCQNALFITNFYFFTAQSGLSRRTCLYLDELRFTKQRLDWGRHLDTSRHLDPFLNLIPNAFINKEKWDQMIEMTVTNVKSSLQTHSLCDVPRPYADNLYTLLVSAAYYYPQFNGNFKLMGLTLDAYRASTAGRHHRIGLLSRLVDLKKDWYTQYLYTDPKPKTLNGPDVKHVYLYHPFATWEQLTAQETIPREIRHFTEETMRDALNHFEGISLDNAEHFSAYLRHRDELLQVYIDSGLKCLRFTYCA